MPDRCPRTQSVVRLPVLVGQKGSLRAYSSTKGQIGILGQIVLALGQIFRPDFLPQDEIIRPGMAFRPLDE